MRGRKVLVLEPAFASPLSLIAEALLLKEHGVEMFAALEPLEAVLADSMVERGAHHIMYLIHCCPGNVQQVISHIQSLRATPHSFDFTLILMPRRTLATDRALESAGLLSDVNVEVFDCDWLALEEDILSFEMGPHIFKDLSADQDLDSLWYIARGLMKFQSEYGLISHIKGKGDWSHSIQRIMSRMRKEAGMDAPTSTGAIDTLVLLDRTVDMISPMCGQLTYEGLLDEVFNLNCGQLKVVGDEGGKKIYGLNSSDAVFRETRDLFYLTARKWLNDTLKTIQQFRDRGMHSADFTQLKGFVSELKDKFIRIPLHTNLIEQLATAFQKPSFLSRQRIEAGILNEGEEMAAIEELIYQDEDLLHVLRLLCLYCTVLGGIPKRAFDPLRRDLLNAYGHKHLLTLSVLSKAGLFYKREGRKVAFPAVKDAFKLLMQEGQGSEAQDIHFTYAGYAPLSIRLIQCALKEGWNSMQNHMSQLPGRQFELLQTNNDSGLPIEIPDAPGPTQAVDARKVVMIVFVGGVTYAEVSALRYMSKHGLVDCDFVVATTSMINGSTLLKPFVVE